MTMNFKHLFRLRRGVPNSWEIWVGDQIISWGTLKVWSIVWGKNYEEIRVGLKFFERGLEGV